MNRTCHFFLSPGGCNRGASCSFSHSGGGVGKGGKGAKGGGKGGGKGWGGGKGKGRGRGFGDFGGGPKRRRVADAFHRPARDGPHIFCDLDGVLVDFEGCVPDGWLTMADPQAKWDLLRRVPPPGFFAACSWMEGGRDLWARIQERDPTVLTGLPRDGEWAARQKRVWCGRELGEGVRVITCMAYEKLNYCRDGDILIDDNERNCAAWAAAGGVAVHHHFAAPRATLDRLRGLGVLGEVDEVDEGEGGGERRGGGGGREAGGGSGGGDDGGDDGDAGGGDDGDAGGGDNDGAEEDG